MEREVSPPEVVVSGEGFSRLADGQMVEEMVLIQQDLSHPASYTSREGLYLNTNALTALTSSAGVPVEFMRMLLLILLVLLYSVKMIRKNREEARLRQLRMLGGSPGEAAFCAMAEMGMQLAAGSLLGLGLFYGISRGILWLVGRWMGAELPLLASPGVFSSTLAVVWTAGVGLTALALWGLLTPLGSRNKNRYRQKSRKTGWLRLLAWEFSVSWLRMAASIVLLAATAVFLAYSLDYNLQVQKASQHVEVDGKMPFDYDFELHTSLQYPMDMEPEDIGVVDFYERAGATGQDLAELASWEGVSEVRGYQGCSCFLSYDGILNRYIDLEDGIEDGEYYMEDQLSQPMAEILGLEQERLLASGITGYPEEDVETFRPYVTEGGIDMEKLDAGEEVVLVIPAFQYEMSWYGDVPVYTKTPVPWDSPEACNGETFQVGDEISFVRLAPLQNYIGTVQADTVQDYVQPVWHCAKVGAIIRTKVGWFENSTIRTSGHYLITTNTGMEALGVDVTYDRVRVYGDSSSPGLSERMLAFQEHLPNMALEDARMELLSYRTLQAATALFCRVMNVLVFLISLLCVLEQLAAKTSRNAMRYSILRVHGLSMGRLRALWLLSLLLVSGGALLLAVPAVSFLVGKWTVGTACVIAGYVLALLLCGTILMTRQVYGYGVQSKEEMNE